MASPSSSLSKSGKLNRGTLRRMAESKLKDAKALLAHRRYEGCVYNCGYAVEFALKARICKTLRWTEYLVSDSYRTFKTHNLEVLLSLTGRSAGVKRKYRNEWTVVSQWDPERRDAPPGGLQKAAAELMVRFSETILRALSIRIAKKLRRVAEKIDREKGPLFLLGMFFREDAPPTWDLIVAAVGLRPDNLPDLDYVSRILGAALSGNEITTLSRMLIFEPGKPPVTSLLEEIDGREGHVDLFSPFGGSTLHAYIIRAGKPSESNRRAKAAPRKAMKSRSRRASRSAPSGIGPHA